MYNPEHHQSSSSFMAPRMSFSSDFVVQPPPPPSARGAAPGDADFEFSLGGQHHPASGGGHSMIAADQLFSKGRLLPLREAPHAARPPTLRAPNIRWKELLGLKKAPKKPPPAEPAAGAATSTDAHMVCCSDLKHFVYQSKYPCAPCPVSMRHYYWSFIELLDSLA
jgi:hypothetical protein